MRKLSFFKGRNKFMKIGIIGHLGNGKNLLNGQTIKTKNLVVGLSKYSTYDVMTVDTHNRYNKLFLFFTVGRLFFKCDAVVMLPAQGGIRVISYLMLLFKFLCNKKIFYDVIGGWLPDFLKDKLLLKKVLKAFDSIWVEADLMKGRLEDMGFSNIEVIPNFKELKILNKSELIYSKQFPLKLCTFSRVVKEKGIEDAVDAVNCVNEKHSSPVFSLDIYGAVGQDQIAWFAKLQERFGCNITYCGCVASDRSVDVLKNYFLLLFPTYYHGEGFAGTLIDAYAAGIPVIASDWKYNKEFVTEKTGFLFKSKNQNEFIQILENISVNPSSVLEKKVIVLEKASEYETKKNIKKLINILERCK